MTKACKICNALHEGNCSLERLRERLDEWKETYGGEWSKEHEAGFNEGYGTALNDVEKMLKTNFIQKSEINKLIEERKKLARCDNCSYKDDNKCGEWCNDIEMRTLHKLRDKP